MKLIPRERRRSDLRMSKPTLISSTGSAAREMRMVSPIPSASSIPRPTADFTVPERRPPASVMPRCKGCSICLDSSR
ncbi:hypothetical protein D3C86_1566320 [compost metagenome]